MDAAYLTDAHFETPAYIFDINRMHGVLSVVDQIRRESGCKILYSIKALPLSKLLERIRPHVDGFSVSSLFEARIAREILGNSGSIHITTPGLKQAEFAEVAELCTHISFNSFSQKQNLDHAAGYSKGLRVNPKYSFLDDPRYDPCRPYSKLGVDIQQLLQSLPQDLEGLHFHTLFSMNDFQALTRILDLILPVLDSHPFKWLNIGGGYLFDQPDQVDKLIQLIRQIKKRYAIEIFMEPGKGLVNAAGFLATRVIDSFESDGKTVVVVDATVNHHPEIFEYQKPAELLYQAGNQTAIVAGCSCLAGDILGEYAFQNLPTMNQVLVFSNVGAYSLIKANRFNGYNLPAIYFLENQTLRQIKHYRYTQYRDQW